MEPGQTQVQLELEQLEKEEKRDAAKKPSSLNPSDAAKTTSVVDVKLSASMCSIWMCKIDGKLDPSLIQTWNPVIEPEKSTIVANSWFERPILNSTSARGIAELSRLQGKGGLFFVGAYSLYSMPLLENGVRSACLVAKELGAAASWGDIQYKGDQEIEERARAGGRGEAKTGGGGAMGGGATRVLIAAGVLGMVGLGLVFRPRDRNVDLGGLFLLKR